MAAKAPECDVCGLRNYTLEEGYYYCNECGTKSQEQREIVEDYDLTRQPTASFRIKKTEGRSGHQVTSWEQINFIIRELTDHLIRLGADDALRLAVLQVWSTYLRRIEVAFFDRKEAQLPRMPIRYRKRDLEMICNRLPAVKKKRIRRVSTDTGSSSHSDKSHKTKQQLIDSEHESFLESQRSDTETSLQALSLSMTSNESQPRRMRFSSNARKMMKHKFGIRKKHINAHEQDVKSKLQCHDFTGTPATWKPTCWTTVCRQDLIRTVLLLGLNSIGATIQLSDLIRWIREGHLRLDDAQSYLPENLDPAGYRDVVVPLQTRHCYSHQKHREFAGHLAKFLRVTPVMPDMYALCVRYLEELCLPAQLATYVKRIIVLCPSKMLMTQKGTFPNYEARAMSYVIFTVKLLFGLDGATEQHLDQSASAVNAQLTNTLHHPGLFRWSEWERYIEMRKVILDQVHAPSNRVLALETGFEINHALETEFLSNTRRSDDPDQLQLVSGNRKWIRGIKTLINSMSAEVERKRISTSQLEHIEFESTLTPFRSYLTKILQDDNANVYVPAFMMVNHTQLAVEPFVNPEPFQKLLSDRYDIRLSTSEATPPLENMDLVEMCTYRTPLQNLQTFGSDYYRVSVHEEDDDSWVPSKINRFERKRDKNLQDQMMATLARNALDNENDATKLTTPNSSFADHTPTKNEHTEDQQKLDLLLPHYNYWIRGGMLKHMCNTSYEEDLAPHFPSSFRFLLQECARVIENTPFDLYRELAILECYFFYALKPVDQIRANESPFLSTLRHCPVNMKPAVLSSIKQF